MFGDNPDYTYHPVNERYRLLTPAARPKPEERQGARLQRSVP